MKLSDYMNVIVIRHPGLETDRRAEVTVLLLIVASDLLSSLINSYPVFVCVCACMCACVV